VLIDYDRFEYLIHRKFNKKCMGYAFVLANQDGIVKKVSGGYAQNPCNGNIPMKTHVYHNIGSVTKALTATALLNLFDKHRLSDASVQDQLDMKIYERLPPNWLTNDEYPLPDSNKNISYRHLLQHRSGIGQLIGSGNAVPDGFLWWDPCWAILAYEPVVPSPYHYDNFNFAMLTYLIPAIAYPQEFQHTHEDNKELPLHEYTEKMRLECGKLFSKYMKNEIFQRSLGNISPSCNPASNINGVYISRDIAVDRIAKSYSCCCNFVGEIWSEVDNHDTCWAAGGYYMTAQELANFGRTLAFTNIYVGPTTRNAVISPLIADHDQRLVFTDTVSHSGFGNDSNLNRDWWIFKCGGHMGSNSALVILPYDHIGVGFSNSGEKECGDLAQAMIDSFYDSTHCHLKKFAENHGVVPTFSIRKNLLPALKVNSNAVVSIRQVGSCHASFVL
jgi:CubicO group peptidase (beta-lactamase class C family)